TGPVLSSGASLLMPNAGILGEFAPLMTIGAGFLMIMDACFNLSMEPYRALLADNLDDSQRTQGLAIQTCLIGIGPGLGSWLPYILNRWCGVPLGEEEGVVGLNVKYAFYIGALVFILTILWTVVKTKEYPPEEYEKYHGKNEDKHAGLGAIFKDFANMPKT